MATVSNLGAVRRKTPLRFVPLVAMVAAAAITRSPLADLNPMAAVIGAIGLLALGAITSYALSDSNNDGRMRKAVATIAGFSLACLVALPAQFRAIVFQSPVAFWLPLSAVALHLLIGLTSAARGNWKNAPTWHQRLESLLGEFIPAKLARLAVGELNILRYVVPWKLPVDVPDGSAGFSYHRHLQPMFWAFLSLALIEIAVLHLLVSRWNATAAWILFIVSDISVLYLIGLINSLRKLPILVQSAGVRVRAGLLIDQWVPIDDIAAVNGAIDDMVRERKAMLKASLLSHPSLYIHLKRPAAIRNPIRGMLMIEAIGVHPDEPAEFMRAVAAARDQALVVPAAVAAVNHRPPA